MSAPLLDHLVLAVPDLDVAVREARGRLGVPPQPGGRHPGWGTRNAILALSPQSYLELIGPDPHQPEPEEGRPFGVGGWTAARLVAWAARADDIDAASDRARRRGLDLGPVLGMERLRPEGASLAWRLTPPPRAAAVAVVPFLIDWGDSAHPAASAPVGASLVSLRAEHPDPDVIRRRLAALDLQLPVSAGAEPALVAVLATPRGPVTLR